MISTQEIDVHLLTNTHSHTCTDIIAHTPTLLMQAKEEKHLSKRRRLDRREGLGASHARASKSVASGQPYAKSTGDNLNQHDQQQQGVVGDAKVQSLVRFGEEGEEEERMVSVWVGVWVSECVCVCVCERVCVCVRTNYI